MSSYGSHVLRLQRQDSFLASDEEFVLILEYLRHRTDAPALGVFVWIGPYLGNSTVWLVLEDKLDERLVSEEPNVSEGTLGDGKQTVCHYMIWVIDRYEAVFLYIVEEQRATVGYCPYPVAWVFHAVCYVVNGEIVQFPFVLFVFQRVDMSDVSTHPYYSLVFGGNPHISLVVLHDASCVAVWEVTSIICHFQHEAVEVPLLLSVFRQFHSNALALSYPYVALAVAKHIVYVVVGDEWRITGVEYRCLFAF